MDRQLAGSAVVDLFGPLENFVTSGKNSLKKFLKFYFVMFKLEIFFQVELPFTLEKVALCVNAVTLCDLLSFTYGINS